MLRYRFRTLVVLMADDQDTLDFALDVVETGDVVLVFPDTVGRTAKFGYHRGQWTLVTDARKTLTAMSTTREDVCIAVTENMETIDVIRGMTDSAWYWFVNDGTEENELYRSHCMCGAFKCSSDVNVVQRWVERHKADCYNDPTIQYE